MDGLTATRKIREGQGLNADTPIVVLSASARSEDHQAGLDAGADAYLTKPIDFGALAEMMSRVPGGREAVGGAMPPASEHSVAA
jgi:CheY-like chemotaxis protein